MEHVWWRSYPAEHLVSRAQIGEHVWWRSYPAEHLVSRAQIGESMVNNNDPVGNENFVLGDTNNGAPKYPAEMTLDELRFWDAVMKDHEVLNLYAADLLP